MYVFPCVILFLCFSVILVLRLPRLGKRKLILVLFVRLFDLCLFGFVGFLFLMESGKGCGLCLWLSLDFSLIFFFHKRLYKARFIANSSSCTTTVLSKLLTSCLTAVTKLWIKYYNTVYERDGINYFWSIKNSNDVLNKFKSKNFQASKLSTYDFYYTV